MPSLTPFLISLFVVTTPTRFEISEISHPNWQLVPGTLLATANEQYDSPAYVDVNGMVRKGDIVIYDMVASDVSYVRIEANCQTQQFRQLRKGEFESMSIVRYQSEEMAWQDASEPYHQALLKFVCDRPQDFPAAGKVPASF